MGLFFCLKINSEVCNIFHTLYVIDNLMSKEIDWKKLEVEYVQTQIGYRDLAKKYNVPFNTLQCRARKEQWVDKRKRFQDKIKTDIEKLQTKKAFDKATIYTEVMDESLLANRKMLSKIIERALTIDLYEKNGIKDFGDAQKIIDSIVKTTEDICFPQHEQTETNINITMDKETKDYAI